MAYRGYKTARFQRKVLQPKLKSEPQICQEAKNCRPRRVERRPLALRSRKKMGLRGASRHLVLTAQARLRAQDFSLKTSFRP